ncbi:kinesin-like protein Klp8, partial [Rhizopus stolonifer]
PLRNLTTQVPVESTVSVHCRNTGEKMANLRVAIAPIARSVRHPYRSSASSVSSAEDPNEPIMDDENPRSLLHVGQQLVFEISIVDISGLDPKLFSRVHAQFRLSTFGSNLEGVFASEAKEYTYKGTLEFNYHQTLSMAITQDILNIIKTKDITFEVYGQPNKQYLQQVALSINNRVKMAAEADTPPVVMPIKKSEDVITRIQICEITPDGDYKPVPVESTVTHSGDVIGQSDTFSLQQGQQRRVVVSLQNASLDKIVDMRIGHIRLMDSKQRILESPLSIAEVPLNLISNSNKDGVCTAHGAWDSSLHDTLLLNAVTPNAQRVVISLMWTVRQKMLLNGNEVDVAVKFEKDLFVHIKDQNKAATIKKKSNPQNKRGSVILNFFSLKSSSHIKNQTTSLFVIGYRPELFGGVLDLPLADLPAQVLGSYEQQRLTMLKREEVESMRYAVHLTEQLDRLCGPSVQKDESKAPLTEQAIMDMWLKKHEYQQPQASQVKETFIKPVVRRWIPQVHQVMVPAMPEESSRSKKGYLMRKNDSDGKEWDKYWCILMGKFLFLYPDQNETSEVDILHIKNVHKEDKTMDTMKSKTLFTIDTLYDSHTFQAPDNATMTEWVNMID